MARTVAKRSSEPLWARVLSCSRHFETMRNFCATLYATPPGFAFTFWGRFPGFRPLRGSTAGLLYTAPPGLKIPLACGSQTPRQLPICSAGGGVFVYPPKKKPLLPRWGQRLWKCGIALIYLRRRRAARAASASRLRVAVVGSGTVVLTRPVTVIEPF